MLEIIAKKGVHKMDIKILISNLNQEYWQLHWESKDGEEEESKVMNYRPDPQNQKREEVIHAIEKVDQETARRMAEIWKRDMTQARTQTSELGKEQKGQDEGEKKEKTPKKL